MANYTVDILTPSSSVVKGLKADSLLVPTIKGQINVLADHTHVVTRLGNGVLEVKSSEGNRKFHVTHGSFKVLKDKVTILSTVAETEDQIDLDRAKKAEAKAKDKLSGKDNLTDEELLKFQRKLRRAEIRLKMAMTGRI